MCLAIGFYYTEEMSRYLTPSKIALLALISLYTDSMIPSAATIPILSFLISHILPVSSGGTQERLVTTPRYTALSISDYQKATISSISSIPGRTVWDLLLQNLWKINSFDALHVFFENIQYLLQKSPEDSKNGADGEIDGNPKRMLLSRVSPLGSFVRKAQLEFTRLQFHDGVSLWKSFVTYRGPTFFQWKKRNATADSTSFDANLGGDSLDLGSRLAEVAYSELRDATRQQANISTVDVETLLGFQVDQMQSKHD